MKEGLILLVEWLSPVSRYKPIDRTVGLVTRQGSYLGGELP